MEEKKLIRKQIFKLRKECTDSQVEAWSRQIAQKVAELPEFQSAQKILAYADYNHEVMTGFIIEEAWKQGKEVAVPKVVGQDMVFYKLTDFSQLEKGYFGIPENHRVGYGGGFYDRFLEKHLQIKRVAVAFDFQILPSVPTEPTDISPEIIVTENKIYQLTK